ncbi:helix-turn-helix domain-containing protein [Kineosporia succinea]|uniref:Multisubunit Na+/H+ antiporter MnhB subunit n=1 Tax=Kineosporia succinea TaxID=84632 RepID=A0ABT9PA88_9ACTN|nr:helix-turn-helix domain-containing protein [Kineosporia succinea]MDP9829599.1 multisubunit Na+/H+ antiporter MnhB subunit [Kineosporia succinea]
MPSAENRPPQRVLAWIQKDPDRACAAVVLSVLGAIALAGSATHILLVGAYPGVDVTGWIVWTVAGSLEVLAAYAAWEVRRRTGWNRAVPVVVLLMSVTFIILANLAAADAHSWAARLPWAQAFAVAPSVGFLSVAAIAETRGWKRTPRQHRSRPRERPSQKNETARNPKNPDTAHGRVDTSEGKGRGRSPGTEPEPPNGHPIGDLHVQAGEERTQTIRRWLQEGHAPRDIRRLGPQLLNVHVSTVKRELQGVTSQSPDGDGLPGNLRAVP